MLRTLTLPGRMAYRLSRVLGWRRLGVFAAGVGAGLLLAPVPGAELRDNLRRRWEDRRTPVSDVDIAARIRHELAQSPRTWHLPQPEVEVVAGKAIVTGEAPHSSGKADIERAVAAVAGVVEVDSRLVIEPR